MNNDDQFVGTCSPLSSAIVLDQDICLASFILAYYPSLVVSHSPCHQTYLVIHTPNQSQKYLKQPPPHSPPSPSRCRARLLWKNPASPKPLDFTQVVIPSWSYLQKCLYWTEAAEIMWWQLWNNYYDGFVQLNEESFGNLQDTLNLKRVMASEKLKAFSKNWSLPACSIAQAMKKWVSWFISFSCRSFTEYFYYEIRANVKKWKMYKSGRNGMSE